MALKIHRPTSPGRRSMSGPTFDEITKDKPEKSLVVSLKRKGENNRPPPGWWVEAKTPLTGLQAG
jgi:large subunit ribosomal protein L2